MRNRTNKQTNKQKEKEEKREKEKKRNKHSDDPYYEGRWLQSTDNYDHQLPTDTITDTTGYMRNNVNKMEKYIQPSTMFRYKKKRKKRENKQRPQYCHK